MKNKLLTGIIASTIIILCSSLNAFGENRNQPITTLAFGAYELQSGSESVSGSQFSSHIDESGDTYTLEATTYTFSTGIKWNWILKKAPFIIPYISGGIALQNYVYEFNAPNSNIGTTSGVGYGPLASLGIRFRVGRNFTLIPEYYYSLLTITSGSGDQVSVTSAGTSLALIFGF